MARARRDSALEKLALARVAAGMAQVTAGKVGPAPMRQPEPASRYLGQERYRALGRQRAGEMNRTEARFATRLELQRQVGEVLDWRFEPMKLRLARATFFDVDFGVTLADRTYCIFDVKGGYAEEDSRVKIKVAADRFPQFRFFVAWEEGRDRWKLEEVLPAAGKAVE